MMDYATAHLLGTLLLATAMFLLGGLLTFWTVFGGRLTAVLLWGRITEERIQRALEEDEEERAHADADQLAAELDDCMP